MAGVQIYLLLFQLQPDLFVPLAILLSFLSLPQAGLIQTTMRLLALTSFLLLLATNNEVFVSADSGLYPPGLLPLINKGNILLSSGQFNEAARLYSEAIGELEKL